MKVMVLWFAGLVLLSGCSRPLDLDSSRLFQEAEKTFAAAKSPDEFLKAAAMDQEILDRGQISGAVLYNQGNAFMQAAQRGRAIAAYRRARRYLGPDPLLEANLSYALGNQPAVRRRPLVEYLLFWQDWLSYPDKFYLAAGCVGGTFLLAVAVLFVRRRLLARLALLGLALSVLLTPPTTVSSANGRISGRYAGKSRKPCSTPASGCGHASRSMGSAGNSTCIPAMCHAPKP